MQSPIAYQKELTKDTGPELSTVQKNSLLRKTNSQPQAKTSATVSEKQKKQQDAKHSRCRSVPHHIQTDKVTPDGDSKKTCPASPTNKDGQVEKLKLETKKTASGGLGSSSGSPKPKRTMFEGFKNSLRPKSKGHESSKSSSAADSAHDTPYAKEPSQHAADSGECQHGCGGGDGATDVVRNNAKQGSTESTDDTSPVSCPLVLYLWFYSDLCDQFVEVKLP